MAPSAFVLSQPARDEGLPRLNHRAFACYRYTSEVEQRPCEMVIFGVSVGSSLLGYSAADIGIPKD